MPYLGVDEQSTYIDVECDGYFWRFTWSDWDAFPMLLNDPASSAHFGKIRESLYVGGTYYFANYDPNRTVVLSVVTATRVAVVLTGTYYDARGGNQIPNALTCTILLTLYENSAFARVTLHVPATTTIDSADYGSLFGMACYNSSGRIYNYGTATTDTTTTGSPIDVTSYNYAGEREASFNYQGMLIEEDSTPATEIILIYGYYSVNPVGTLAAGDYEYTIGYFMNAPDSVNDVIPDSTARLAIGNEFTNISTDMTTTGDPVTDRNIPAQIDLDSGFCADGAFHLTSDSNNAGKLTIDIDRALMGVVIEDWPVMTGDPGSPDEYLTFWDKMDSVTNNHEPAYPEGAEVTVAGSPSLVDSVKGDGTLFDAVGDGFTMPIAHIDPASFTIKFSFKADAPAGNDTLFAATQSTTAFLFYRYSDTHMQLYYNGSAYSLGTGSDDVLFDGDWHECSLVGNTTTGRLILIVDHTLYDVAFTTTVLVLSGGVLKIGNWSTNYDNPCNGIIDNFKIYSAPILPYGSFIPGDIIHSEEYDRAHSDITLYSNTTSLDIGTTSITNISNIDNSEGTIAFRVDPATALSADETLFSAGTDFHIKWDDSDDDIVFTYGTASVRTTVSITAGLDGEHWIDCKYKASGDILLIVDGIEYSASASTAPTLGSAIAWSSNVGMTMRTITSNTSTPTVSTVNGKPILYPVIKSEVA